MEVAKPPFDEPVQPGRWSRRAKGSERWVKPEVVVEVSFSEWTRDGHVRHPSFKGVRTDKPARQITREPVIAAPAAAASAPAAKRSSVQLSNPERVIDPSTGLKKVDLFRYDESVAEWILPHLEDRPVMLVRAPEGLQGKLLFQRHPETPIPARLELHRVARRRAGPRDLRHGPGEAVPFGRVIEAALVTKALLEELGLKSWLKTSGGNGLHVVVPLTPKASTQEVLGFAKAVVEHMARTIPSRFVAKTGARNRVDKIFIDYIRNAEGAIATAREYLSFRKVDPWAGYWRERQALASAVKRLRAARQR